MPAYFGSKQLFRNRNGGGATREIYFGNNIIMGFKSADYVTSEIVPEKAPAGESPEISTGSSMLVVRTKNYNPGYGFSKYYCDHVKIVYTYSGGFVMYDCEGNVKVEISAGISFSYLSANWTITSKCAINGSTVFDESYTSRDTPANKLTYEVYFNTSTRKWTVMFDGRTFTGGAEEWKPSYFRALCQMWFISSTSGITMLNGSVGLSEMNKAVGYPSAK